MKFEQAELALQQFDLQFPNADKSAWRREDGAEFEKRMVGDIGIMICFDDEGCYGNRIYFLGWQNRQWIRKCICMESTGGPMLYMPREQRYVHAGYDFSMSFPNALHLMFKDLKVLLKLVRERKFKRCLVLAMGLHRRLGAACPFAALGQDLVMQICCDL